MAYLKGKKVLLGVTGGIAAYKTCEVIRRLTEQDVEIRVVMTKGAQQFVTPLTFETLSRHPVMKSMFSDQEMVGTRHVDVSVESDLVVVCPATANILGKAANGIADDLLSTMLLVAGPEKTVYCPAMNTRMWEHPAVQQNVETLKKMGARFVMPEYGPLAEQAQGVGRLAAVDRILSRIRMELLRTQQFSEKRFVISAGPTEEPMDPVRYITNASSGKMGFSLAEAALSKGAKVTLVSGPVQLTPPDDVQYISVRTAAEMEKAVIAEAEEADFIIMAAAVSDYRPETYSQQKIKKSASKMVLHLEKTTDILAKLGRNKGNRILIGFAVETENTRQHARKKLAEKNLDMIVLNNPNVEGAAFRADTNVVTVLTAKGEEVEFPKMSKLDLAHALLEEVYRYQQGLGLAREKVFQV